jgi:membrane associated rhomboid family serine protease
VIPVGDTIRARRFPLVTVAIIVANGAVWLFYQVPQPQHSVVELSFKPCEVQHACPDPGISWPFDVVSAMFAHGSWLHIIGNMLFLWVFGDNVEDAMGRIRFSVFYLLSGVAATALQTSVTLGFGSGFEASIPNIGASGAIAGVLGAYFFLYPAASVIALVPLLLFLIPVQLPALFFLGFWFLFQLWQGGFSLIAPTAGGGVAFFAHVGGFLFGGLALRLFVVRRRVRIVPR